MKIKKAIKRFLILTLALIMLLTICLAVACEEKPDVVNEKNKNGSETGSETVPQTREDIPDDLPPNNFSGREFRVLTRDYDHYAIEIEMAEDSADIVDHAVYMRNMTVEERFNTKIKAVIVSGSPSDTLTKKLRTDVMAGDVPYEMVSGFMMALSQMAPEGILLNWHKLPNMNFGKPWWNKSAMDELTVAGKSFFALSDMLYSPLCASYCVFYNKTLSENYGLDNIYDVVNDGKWTIDYARNAIKDIYVDLDNDGQRNSADLYGWAGNIVSGNVTFLWAFDNPVTKHDSNGIPQLVINNPKTPQIIDKLHTFWFETKGAIASTPSGIDGIPWFHFGITLMRNSRTIFYPGNMVEAETDLRDLKDDYGIIPYPKWDENQENYYTMVDGDGSLMAIPNSISSAADIDFVTTIIEALSAEEYKKVIPAYYEVALKVKYSRDAESVLMLDKVVEGIRYDFGFLYDGFVGFGFQMMIDLFNSGSRDFASYYAANEERVKIHYNNIIQAYLDF